MQNVHTQLLLLIRPHPLKIWSILYLWLCQRFTNVKKILVKFTNRITWIF